MKNLTFETIAELSNNGGTIQDLINLINDYKKLNEENIK